MILVGTVFSFLRCFAPTTPFFLPFAADFLPRVGVDGGGDERELDSGSGDGEESVDGGGDRVEESVEAAGDAMLPMPRREELQTPKTFVVKCSLPIVNDAAWWNRCEAAASLHGRDRNHENSTLIFLFDLHL